MEENILVKSERFKIKKIMIILVCICLLVAISMFTYGILKNINYYENYCYDTFMEDLGDDFCGGYYNPSMFYGYKCDRCITYMMYSSGLEYALSFPTEYDLCFIIPLAVMVFIIFIYLWLCKYEMTITNKRIYGKMAFGKKVDFPIESIIATTQIQALKCITISTASGKFSFLLIKNNDAVYSTLNKFQLEQQKTSNPFVSSESIIETDDVQQLKKFKELLDSGIITQEEFDKKKKELLGL